MPYQQRAFYIIHYQSRTINCECGDTIKYFSRYTHRKSARHTHNLRRKLKFTPMLDNVMTW